MNGFGPSARENFVDMGGDSIFRGISRPEEGEISGNKVILLLEILRNLATHAHITTRAM